MSTARLSDGLLSAGDTISLIELLAMRGLPTEKEPLLHDLAAITPISWARAKNTIAKLSNYGLVRKSDASRLVIVESVETDWWSSIVMQVAQELTERLTKENAWSCLKLDSVSGDIKIDSLMLPSMQDGLGVWIIDFGIAKRSSIGTRHWTIASEYKHLFLVGAGKANRQFPRRPKSAARLAADLDRQAQHGEEAEEWALEFERRRLQGHPLRDQIRRISQDDVAAGYDILSFASETSLHHDLFIEVKSHGDTKLFHWSRNEIAVAQEFGEAYALYLVDRNKSNQAEYSPHIITAPSPEMFSAPDSGWTVEATSFEHLALQGG